jgi:hypothetical protein
MRKVSVETEKEKACQPILLNFLLSHLQEYSPLYYLEMHWLWHFHFQHLFCILFCLPWYLLQKYKHLPMQRGFMVCIFNTGYWSEQSMYVFCFSDEEIRIPILPSPQPILKG